MRGAWFVGLSWLLLLVGCRGPELTPVEELDTGAPSAAQEPLPKPPRSEVGQGGVASSDGEQVVPGPEAGAPGLASECQAQPITLAEAHSGQVRPNVAVALDELVASSQKFLVSEAKSGSCLWGAFAAGVGVHGPGSGMLLVSFGAKHEAGASCQSGSDGLPDDLEPGDRLRVQGYLSDFVPGGCDEGTAAQAQLRIDAACPAQRVGRADEPTAEVISPSLADSLAAGRDAELLRAYGGALVELTDVSAVQDADDGDAVFPFGVVRLAQTALEVRSRIYYFDLADGGPRSPSKALALPFPTELERVRGVVFLDYCTWSLGPRDRCHDLSPASGGCPAQAHGP